MSLTADESIKIVQDELNAKLVAFDKWASFNPDKLKDCMSKNDPNYESCMEFLQWKQEIKLLRLKLNEYNQIKNNFQNTLKPIRFQL
jgi:hypothetical protein